MNKKLIISAHNIHVGGGKVLLQGILSAGIKGEDVTCFVDHRYPVPSELPNNIEIFKVRSTVFSRISAESRIAELANLNPSNTTVLCFGNLPPLFDVRSKVAVFVQNKYLVQERFFNLNGAKTFFRSVFEKIWFNVRSKPQYQYFVQTQTMKNSFIGSMGHDLPISIAGFSSFKKEVTSSSRGDYFCYIASGEKHKNHVNLLKAWKLLKSQYGITPELKLVLNKASYPDLCLWTEQFAKDNGLCVELISSLERNKLVDFLSGSKALVFPSLFESFGLPMIEAENLGVPILASDRDYVFDVITPAGVFDPLQPSSIARAICKFMNIEMTPNRILESREFVEKVLDI
ncbi:MAG: glycosyltransferase [Bacteriovoracaceae bacterium]|jgi:glycosyltransferase involved in cell wall biosynthesis|nr:glycosyltransferase [Bacteriovoracaceae bacterium]